MKEVNYEKLPDGTIHIPGLFWELHETSGCIYDVDGVVVGEYTEDCTKILLYDEE